MPSATTAPFQPVVCCNRQFDDLKLLRNHERRVSHKRQVGNNAPSSNTMSATAPVPKNATVQPKKRLPSQDDTIVSKQAVELNASTRPSKKRRLGESGTDKQVRDAVAVLKYRKAGFVTVRDFFFGGGV
jgi:hypothetical protein